jgi:phosphoglycolate phosphatase
VILQSKGMKYQLAIFDFDGTLADTAELMSAVLQRAAVRFGFRQTTPAEVEMLRGMRNREIIRYLGVPLWKLPAIAVYARQIAAAEGERSKLFPGTQRMLAELADAGVGLGIVTSNSEETVRRALGEETAAKITYYECGASLFGKAAEFKTILKRSGVPASAVLAIGDESRDMDAAKAAGIAAGAVTWGYATAELLRACEPAEIFDTREDVTRIIRGQARDYGDQQEADGNRDERQRIGRTYLP